jgi:hypothetical protein
LRPEMRRIIFCLLAGALFLPIAILLILSVGRLLLALEDPGGGALFGRLALVLGVTWALDVICLPIVLAVQALIDKQRTDDDRE